MELKQLMKNFPKSGRIEWIGIREERGATLSTLNSISISVESGLTGDHYRGTNKKRQVTLIQKEHIEVVEKILGIETIDPSLLRRNIVVSGLNLLGLKDFKFRLGTAILEYTGLCHPCTRMEKNLGMGGYNAMRGHGGITARVIEDGLVNLGDELVIIDNV
ncbi:MAG: MOSC domain-containing protein [Cytophagales bacterium]|nr:MOSC domain-containing protein [Cytophagales bacterium]